MKNYIVLLKKLLNILFFRRTWSIGYRFIDSESFSLDEERKYNVIDSCLRWWYADPFCIKKDDKYYIFCEMLDSFSGRGSIGVFEYYDGVMSNIRQVLKEPFHLSYPNVFSYNNEYYMIPETGDARQIRLYKATEFPYRWELDTILLEGKKVVDSTILTIKDKMYLFAYDLSGNHGRLEIYDFDIDKKCLRKLDSNSFIDEDRKMRPAGNFLNNDKDIVRPAQYGTESYGIKLLFNKIEKMPDEGYQESTVSELTVSDITVFSNRKFTRVHTINRYCDMEVIDLFCIDFCMIKPVFVFTKLLVKIYEKIKQWNSK